jgi:hypothetical protein
MFFGRPLIDRTKRRSSSQRRFSRTLANDLRSSWQIKNEHIEQLTIHRVGSEALGNVFAEDQQHRRHNRSEADVCEPVDITAISPVFGSSQGSVALQRSTHQWQMIGDVHGQAATKPHPRIEEFRGNESAR